MATRFSDDGNLLTLRFHVRKCGADAASRFSLRSARDCGVYDGHAKVYKTVSGVGLLDRHTCVYLDASMQALVELEALTKELAAAAHTLGDLGRRQRTEMDADSNKSLASLVSPSASTEIHEAWRRVVSSAGQVQRILSERAGMVQHVAIQVGHVVGCRRCTCSKRRGTWC
jgi:hypothetical protein